MSRVVILWLVTALYARLCSAQPGAKPAAPHRASASAASSAANGAHRSTTSASPAAPTLVRLTPLVDERGGALAPFFDKLLALKAGRRKLVRVSHFGDSHVASDFLTEVVRSELQRRFGDAGAGFVLLGMGPRSYRHAQVSVSRQGLWRVERQWARYTRGRRRPRDEYFGVAGVSVHSRWRHARLLISPRTALADFTLYFLHQRRGGWLDVFADDRLIRRVMTVGRRNKPLDGYRRVVVPRSTSTIRMDVRGGEVRLYGADLRSGRPGVIYDAIGLNGTSIERVLSWQLLPQHVARLAPDLVVIAYGSNDIDADAFTGDGFSRAADRLLSRLRGPERRACLVIGPPDQARRDDSGTYQTPDNLAVAIGVLRRLAKQRGCAFWDQQQAMGGAKAIFRWQQSQPSWARADHVHFSVAGYRALGQALATAIFEDLQAYQLRQAARGSAAP